MFSIYTVHVHYMQITYFAEQTANMECEQGSEPCLRVGNMIIYCDRGESKEVLQTTRSLSTRDVIFVSHFPALGPSGVPQRRLSQQGK